MAEGDGDTSALQDERRVEESKEGETLEISSTTAHSVTLTIFCFKTPLKSFSLVVLGLRFARTLERFFFWIEVPGIEHHHGLGSLGCE